MIEYLGRFHPMMVHFPIALTLTCLFCEVIFLIGKKAMFAHTARVCIVLAALFSIVTVILGWFAGSGAPFPGKMGEVLDLHRILGTTTGVLIILAALSSEFGHWKSKSSARLAYRVLLLASAGVIGFTGHLGASLVYGLNYWKF